MLNTCCSCWESGGWPINIQVATTADALLSRRVGGDVSNATFITKWFSINLPSRLSTETSPCSPVLKNLATTRSTTVPWVPSPENSDKEQPHHDRMEISSLRKVVIPSSPLSA